ncbi:EpsG family protein [Buttiauxella ferragutiae]|uniref:EpsG family protein n=1 Tax=Buttiauxella ferragutiae TaxID=82989 RepID=UPI001F53AED7|nr:EpsG family protein [Buttiauxella ferragutiae]UNK62863.1 EpsG family protein [Buttiauxella ferragutiae]
MPFNVFIYFIPMMFLSFLEVASRKKTQVFYLYIMACALTIFFIAFAFHLGVDWLEYQRFFLGISSSEANYEMGYTLLNKVLYISGADFWFLNYIVKFFFFFTLFCFIYKFSLLPVFSLTFFIGIVFPFINDPLRQLISSLFLFGAFLLLNRPPKVIAIIIGSMFHSSFFVSLVLLFRKYQRKNIIIIFFAAGLFFFMFTLSSFLLGTVNFYPLNLIMLKISYYMKNNENASYASTSVRIVFLVFVCFSVKVRNCNVNYFGYDHEKTFWVLALFYLILEIGFLNLPIIPQRVRIYILPCVIVLFSNYLFNVVSTGFRLVITVIIFVYCSLSLYSFISKPVGSYYTLDNNLIIHNFTGDKVKSNNEVDDFWIYQD